MKATVTKEEVFTVHIGGLDFTNMRVESRWEGLTKLVDKDGQCLTVLGMPGRDFGSTLTALFGDVFGAGEAGEVSIMMASPALALKIRQAGEGKAA